MANTIRAGGLTRKGPGSRSGSVPVVPPQQQPDNMSNAALCGSGPGLVEQAGRACLQRGNGWAILRPVRVEVEHVANHSSRPVQRGGVSVDALVLALASVIRPVRVAAVYAMLSAVRDQPAC